MTQPSKTKRISGNVGRKTSPNQGLGNLSGAKETPRPRGAVLPSGGKYKQDALAICVPVARRRCSS
jgi:hypothetical protein